MHIVHYDKDAKHTHVGNTQEDYSAGAKKPHVQSYIYGGTAHMSHIGFQLLLLF